METLMAISVTVIAAIMVLALIFQIPVLLQVRRTAREAEKLIDSVRVPYGCCKSRLLTGASELLRMDVR